MPRVVHFDPTTGLYIDPATGQASTDPHGANPANPALAAQASRNLGISNQLLSGLAQPSQQYQGAQQSETDLANSLKGVIAGTAPSVAQGQLTQGVGQARSAAESIASGAGGTNAALARMQAVQSTGDAAAQANQSASLVRAGETAAARGQLGQVLGQQAGQAIGMYGTNLSGALGASGQAAGAEGTAEQIQAQKDAQTRQLIANLVAGGGSAAATYATGGASKVA
jgi:hypothetical protein